MTNLDTLASRLVRAMSHTSTTYDKLSEVTGHSTTWIWKIRAGRTPNPTILVVKNMADAMGVRPAWLAFGEGTMQ